MDQEPAEPEHSTETAESTELEVDLASFLPEGVTLAPEPDAGAESAEPEVDLELLGRLEDDLTDVDQAIRAIDAGDMAASPLLQRLLAD